MRVLKFRAWDTKDNYFISMSMHKVGALLTDDGLIMSTGYDSYDMPTFGKTYEMKNYKEYENYINRFIYEQFTGLKDKNGVELYEGDIIENQDLDIRQVKYVNNGFEMRLMNGARMGDIVWHLNFKIIGNIHQNKNLLK